MINIDEAKVLALVKIADIVGKEYLRNHFEGSCSSWLKDQNAIDFEYFIGFDEEDDQSENWNIFAYVSVNRETKEVTILDYKTPDGKRMENPIKPTSFA